MLYETLLYGFHEEGIAQITLNRPEVANAANVRMCEEFAQAIHNASQDSRVKVIVITGAGKAFSAGGDIEVILNAGDVFDKAAISKAVNKAVLAAEQCPKPMIAAVNGAVGGGGICFALFCDLILASEKATFAFNFIGIAACPDGGASYFLPRKLGYGKAFELLVGGKVITAQEALRIGLVQHVIPDHEFMTQVIDFATKMTQGPILAQQLTKALLKGGMRNSLEAQLELEGYAQLLAWSSREFEEGTRAFFEKRTPRFNR